jgi:hypothetical protein
MKSLRMGMAFIAMIGVTVAAPVSATDQDRTPVAYFLNQIPPGTDALDHLPSNAKDVIVAKVRLQEPVIWLGGRHCERCTNDIFGTRLKITEVLRGRAEAGQVFDVLLGRRSDHRRFIAIPNTPDQRGQEYTVTIYLAEDGLRRLAAFPISQLEYEKWNAEVSSYERLRGKPGFRE